ncbi:MAG: FAD-dependent oxidoreductase, partial [Luminiphilus sp.]
MDCCRTARRLGGEDVKVVVRSEFAKMKASPWEIEDAQAEDIPIINNHVPKAFVHEDGKLLGMTFDQVEVVYDDAGKRSLVPTGEEIFFEADEVLIAIGQDNAFPWIERNLGIEFGKWDMPQVDERSFQSSNPKVFFGGDAAFGPENIITAVAHGHQAAVSIDLFLSGKSVQQRPAPGVNLLSQKMGVHEWSYDNLVTIDLRQRVPHVDKQVALKDRKVEVELGFDIDTAYREAERCLNCDVQTVFDGAKCIECDGCTDICPTDCINFIDNAEEPVMRRSLRAPACDETQDLYVSERLAQTQRVMVKDENVCLHCGLCAERCPTGAWDMQRFLYSVTKAG